MTLFGDFARRNRERERERETLHLPTLPADKTGMNVYVVAQVNGDFVEVEAEFFERDGEDWVFYAVEHEALRIGWLDVLSVSKCPLGRRLHLRNPHTFGSDSPKMNVCHKPNSLQIAW